MLFFFGFFYPFIKKYIKKYTSFCNVWLKCFSVWMVFVFVFLIILKPSTGCINQSYRKEDCGSGFLCIFVLCALFNSKDYTHPCKIKRKQNKEINDVSLRSRNLRNFHSRNFSLRSTRHRCYLKMCKGINVKRYDKREFFIWQMATKRSTKSITIWGNTTFGSAWRHTQSLKDD